MKPANSSALWLAVLVFVINASVITAQSTTESDSNDSIFTTPEPLCSSDTCLNNGTCRELEDWECSNDLDIEHTVCVCTPSFTGSRCEYSIRCGGQKCGNNDHCVYDKCVSLTDSSGSTAPQCKPGVHPLTYKLDMRNRKKPIVCLDMYYTNTSSYCYDKDDSIEFEIVEEEVVNLFCLNLDYRLWQTCIHVNSTINNLNFPDKPVSKVTLIAKENDMHPRSASIVFSVTFNTAPEVSKTTKTYVVNLAEEVGPFLINVSGVFGVLDNDTVSYSLKVDHPQVMIIPDSGQLNITLMDGNEEDISVDIEIKDDGIPSLTTVVSVKMVVLILSCDIKRQIYVNYQQIGNPVGKITCRISKGYDISDLTFVFPSELKLEIMPDGILKVVEGLYGDRTVLTTITLAGKSGEISVELPFKITIADIWTGSYVLNRTWSQDYAVQTSFLFGALVQEMANNIQLFFSSQNVTVNVNVEMFSKSSDNLVTVHFTLIFPKGQNSEKAVSELRESIQKGPIGDLTVNATRLIINNQVGSTQVSEMVYSSSDASNTPAFTKDNTEVQLECIGTFVQPVGDVTVEWRMTASNALVVPLAYSRLQTNLTSPNTGHYIGTLVASNISFKDSGQFHCTLRDESGLSSSKAMTVSVIPRPVVTVLPLKRVFIRSGETTTLSCNTTGSWVPVTNFSWFSNGKSVGRGPILRVTGGSAHNATYSCVGVNGVGAGEQSPSTIVFIIGAETIRCDEDGKWHGMRAGLTAEYPCPKGGTAVMTRSCGKDGRWQDEDRSQCLVRLLEGVIDDIEWIEEGLRVANISSVARALSNATQPEELTSKWIVLAIQALGRLLNITKSCKDSKEETQQFIEGFVESVSNILDSRTVGEWKKLEADGTSPTAVLQLLDKMTEVTTNRLDEGDVHAAESTNIVLQLGKTDPGALKDIEFPANSGTNTVTSNVHLKLDSMTLKQFTDATVRFSAIYYKDILPLLPTGERLAEPADNTMGKNGSEKLVVNSGLLAFNLFPAPTKSLDPPLKMNFTHTDLSLIGEGRMCVYLNTLRGLWDHDGCNTSISGTSFTECSCGHLTNFAVLMSPDARQIIISHPLTPAEIACCSIEIVLLVLTVIVYALTWRYVKSDQAVIVIHICVCLAVALLLLMIGIGRDEYGLCIAFAVAVHFFYMATFFMMLASGLEALWSDSHVFPNRSKLKPLLIGAWGLTVLAVIISCAQLQVYEPGLHCWLSLAGDSKWLFIVPVLIILVINFFVIGKMIHNHLARRALRNQDDPEKETKPLHLMCFMIPVLGLAWIFGLLSVQDGSDVYDYLFAVISILQGFMIFITQCIVNTNVRKGVINLRRPRDQHITEGVVEMDALREDAERQNASRESGAYHCIDDTCHNSDVTESQQYESLEASQRNENVYDDMDHQATQIGLFAKEFSQENQYANELSNPVGGVSRRRDPSEKARSGDHDNRPSDALYRNVQDTERKPMIPSRPQRI
ncbi:uncharacterized protein LOC124149128 isoform X2 [Haliotis rufescens]|uniref:uncharacterized protein LOC124149128 isoform X2 n=1 Tax=Haliotis rufescens TaxID=6454 RepID=UPI00201E82C7|nr:uncharacterized protein LOC124149128 isoform X2 [Haliotis rufescens]